jgi:hypothetical protein
MHASLASLTFGAELEVLVPSHIGRVEAARQVTAITGLPVHAPVGGCPSGSWKIVSDGSVEGAGHGLEFVSPVLSGDDGLNQVAQVANALRQIGCTVNQTCGFHVHVGGFGTAVRIDFFKTLVKLYGRYEEAIDQLMPPSRRDNGAYYCKSVKMVRPEAIDAATTIPQLSAAIYRASGASGTRYHKVNLDAYAKHKTVEFRQHSGTVDGAKATNWIITCLQLVAAAKAGKTGEAARIARDFSQLDAKARATAEAISRPEGATANEIRTAHGFKALSVKRQAMLAGIELRIVKTRGVERFFATGRVDASAPTPATLEGLAEVIGGDAEYFRDRAAAVRG